MSEEPQDNNLEQSFAEEIDERLRSVKSPTERRTLAGLLKEIAHLPFEQTRAALETSAAIAAVSLRASIEFLRAAPAVAQVLEAPELRAWGELGRRLTMAEVENGVSFFTAGLGDFANVPAAARPFVFQVCSRQMILSASTASETFRHAPVLAETLKDSELLRSIYEVAAEISRRSAKHSSDFLNVTPSVIAALHQEDKRVRFSSRLLAADPEPVAGSSPPLNGAGEVTRAAVALAAAFAERAGGIAADAWTNLPGAVDLLDTAEALKLMRRSVSFLERGGAAALHLLIAGGEILRTLPECFDEWIELLWAVASHGNAGLVAFIRSSPAFFQTLSTQKEHLSAVTLARRVLALTREVARVDSEAALACLRSSAKALHTVSIEQFESWSRAGLIAGNTRARRSYYALETRSSNEALREGGAGVALESVQLLLRLYVEGLTGRAVEIAALAAVPVESRIGDGRTIHLPSIVTEFGDEELDFRLYKVLAAHAAGQIEFETYARDTNELRAAYRALAEFYDPANQDARDAFALGGYIENATGMDDGEPQAGMPALPATVDYRLILNLFPIPP
ncbi:MAG: nitric oxide reductase NorD protein, partial [Blastocatellia bacterium]|nr:nitric oxide reductase NorD protein [Blastocatellia bacterium]